MRRPVLTVIGAGPKALAIAAKSVVLAEAGYVVPELHIVDRAGVGAHWTGAAGYTDGRQPLGTSPEKDVGFPYESTFGPDVDRRMQRYTWQSHLVARRGWSDWVDRGRPAPTHREWAAYLQWVADEVRPHVNFHTGEVRELEVDGRCWRVNFGAGALLADGVVITGPGPVRPPPGTPEHPAILTPATFWKHTGAFGHAVVVGTGETAAAICVALAARARRVDVVSPLGAAHARGESYRENRVYSDPTKGRWQALAEEHRRDFIRRTDRGVFSPGALAALDGADHLDVVPGRVVRVSIVDDRPRLDLEYEGARWSMDCDQVVLATGGDPLALVGPALGGLSRARVEGAIAHDLSVTGVKPRLHLPMLAGLAQGPGFANLSCLGRLSDRILETYVMKCTTVLESPDAARVNALRLDEYAAASGFRVAPAGIVWNRSDDQSTVLGCWQDGEIVSTMRLELIDSPALLERKLECPWSFPVELAFPVLVLSKAATRRTHQGGGFNALLRLHALELARRWGVRHVVGTFVAGSPRERSMRAMGYQLFTNALGWTDADYRSERPVLVAVLDLSKDFDTAANVCRTLAGPLLAEFPWQGEQPAARLVEVVK